MSARVCGAMKRANSAVGVGSKRQLYDWVNAVPVESMTQRAVLKAIAEFADPSGETWREQGEIASRVFCSERTVRRTLRRLEEMGLIARRHRYSARGKRTSDRIRLCCENRLPVTVAGSEWTTGHRDSDYRTPCPSLPVSLSGESTESTLNQSPQPPPGESGGGTSLLKIEKGKYGFAHWVARYRANGDEAKADEAERLGYMWVPSRWPPPTSPEDVEDFAGSPIGDVKQAKGAVR